MSARPMDPAGDEATTSNSGRPSDGTASRNARRDDMQTAWGFPAFARDFPSHPELDALVAAFSRGDYAKVREGAPKLVESTTDEAVRKAAGILRERIEPDPASKLLFLFAAALLVFLSAWWVAHDGADEGATASPKLAPKTEHAD